MIKSKRDIGALEDIESLEHILSPPPPTKKELALEKRKKAKEFKKLINNLTPIICLAVLAFGVLFIKDPESKLPMIGAAGIMAMGLSFKYPRKALWFFTFYMPFGGTVTYWLAGGNSLVQLAKDAFYVPALVGLYLQCRKEKEKFFVPKGLNIFILILLSSCLLTLVAVNVLGFLENNSLPLDERREGNLILQGILGLKVFMGYIPLIACFYHLLRTRNEFLFFTRSQSVLAIICTTLNLIQYYFLLSGRCKGTEGLELEGDLLFKASVQAKCLVGGALLYTPSQGVIRLPGTFVAPWQWGWFLISGAFLTYAVAFSDRSPLWRIVGLVSMAGIMASAVVSGQRIALALVPVCFVLLTVLTGQVANVKRFLPIGIGILILIAAGLILFPDLIQERIESFQSRITASSPDDFIGHQFEFVFKAVSDKPFGFGLGTATNSTRLFGKTKLIETWFPKVTWEVGFVGLFVFLILVSAITWMTFKTYRSVKDKSFRSYGACFWVFVLVISYQTYYYPLDVDPVAVYYWMVAGALFKLPELDKKEQEYQRIEALKKEFEESNVKGKKKKLKRKKKK